jgi:hypothetical protein
MHDHTVVMSHKFPNNWNDHCPLMFYVDPRDVLRSYRGAVSGATHFKSPVIPDHFNWQMYGMTTSRNIESVPEFWINQRKYTGVAAGATGSGPAAGNGTGFPFRLGTTELSLIGHGTYSYVLIYTRILSDAEMVGIYDYFFTLLRSLGVTMGGFASHLMQDYSLSTQVVTRSSDSTGAAWGVLAGNSVSSKWRADTKANEWVQVYLGANQPARVLGSYSFANDNDFNWQRLPRDWTVKGSNDGVAWTLLHSVTGEPDYATDEVRMFNVDTLAGPFRYFRFDIAANNHASLGIFISEIYLYEDYAPAGGYIPRGLLSLGFGV